MHFTTLIIILGVLSARWRLLQRPIIAKPENAIKVVKAMCVLHNLLRTREATLYTPQDFVDNDNDLGGWRERGQPLIDMAATGARNSAAAAVAMRDKFANYFVSPEGSLHYQLAHINRLN